VPLVDQVIPRVPVRQWVLSFPIPLRILFAAHPESLTPVLCTIHRVIARFLLKQARLKRCAADTGARKLEHLCGYINRSERGGRAFLDRKLGLHKWTNCSIVTAAMPIKRSRSHETITQEPFIEVQSPNRLGIPSGRCDTCRTSLTPRRARHPDHHLAQAVA
jgi:hypothetical protein